MPNINKEELDRIKQEAKDNVSRYSTRDTLLRRYREIYFMKNVETPANPQVDQKDWKVTPSPSGRNEVVGMQRLLNTAELHVDIDDSEDKKTAGPIETGLKAILKASGEGRRGRILSDAALSAVLYGAVTIYAEAIDDLLKVKELSKPKIAFLTEKRKRTPFLLRIINTEQSYPEWDDDMLISHTWKYDLRGSSLKSRWGLENVTANTDYTVYDVFTDKYHVVWSDAIADPIFAGEHGLASLPIFSSFAGGSELFSKPEEQMQSFLYAKATGELDKRENSILTALFTSIHRRGLLGAMYWIDPENAPEEITVDYQQGIMFAKGKVSAVNDKIIDPIAFEVYRLIAELSGASTIRGTALGEEGAGSMPFSSLSMLATSGKLPLTDPERALEQVFTDAFNHILQRIKTEGMANEQIAPAAIDDDMMVKVSMQTKLPQDSLRNAQVAQGLGDLVSDKWKRSELLQISDSESMDKQLFVETMKKSLAAALVQDPQNLQESIALILGRAPVPQPGEVPPGGEQMPPEQMQQGPTPEEMAAMQQQQMQGQGPGQELLNPGMPNMEAMPQSGPMIPPQERL